MFSPVDPLITCLPSRVAPWYLPLTWLFPSPEIHIPHLRQGHHNLPVTQAERISEQTPALPSPSAFAASLVFPGTQSTVPTALALSVLSWTLATGPPASGLSRPPQIHPPQGIQGRLLKQAWQRCPLPTLVIFEVPERLCDQVHSLPLARRPLPVSSPPSSFLVTALDTLSLSRPWPLPPPQPATLWPGLEAETRACWTPAPFHRQCPSLHLQLLFFPVSCPAQSWWGERGGGIALSTCVSLPEPEPL